MGGGGYSRAWVRTWGLILQEVRSPPVGSSGVSGSDVHFEDSSGYRGRPTGVHVGRAVGTRTVQIRDEKGLN